MTNKKPVSECKTCALPLYEGDECSDCYYERVLKPKENINKEGKKQE